MISRQIDILAQGGRIVGDFGDDDRSNLINIRVTQASKGAGDVRLMKWSGLGAFFASGGRTTIDIENAAPMAANLQMWFERCAFSTRDTSTGSALRFGGVLTQLHTVINCQIDNQVHLDGCADACRFVYNTVGGAKTGFRLRLALGAFRTLIAHNVIVPRDGAMLVEGGSQIDFLFNQCEQQAATNRGEKSAHVAFELSEGEMSRRCNIIGNNFGGGSNVDHAIVLGSSRSNGGVEDVTVADNTFGITATSIDIVIADTYVRGTRVIPGNFARGRRANVALNGTTGRAAANNLDGSDLIRIVDRGLGSYGIWQEGSIMRLTSGWEIDGTDPCRFRKTIDNDLQWDGILCAGTIKPQTVIGTLPPGFRPRHNLRCVVATDAGSGTLCVGVDGSISIGAMATGSTLLFMAGVTHRVQGKTDYNPGV
ncbi:MAG: hypothetical protein ABIS14_12685 [Sphingomonas sp.]